MIACTNYKAFVKGALQGFADFYVPKWGAEIKGCSVYMKDGRKWVNMPSKEFDTPTGEKAFAPIIKMREQAHMTAFTKHALDAIDKWIKDNAPRPVTGPEATEAPSQYKDFNDEDLPW